MIQVELTRAAVSAACASFATFAEDQIKAKEAELTALRGVVDQQNNAITQYSACLREIAVAVQLTNANTPLVIELPHVVRERMRHLQALIMKDSINSPEASNGEAQEEPTTQRSPEGAEDQSGVSPEGETSGSVTDRAD